MWNIFRWHFDVSFHKAENIVGKGENAAFSPKKYFQKASFQGH